MNIESEIFKKYSADFDKLIEYGFQKEKISYSYEKLFRNNEFKAVINITNNGNVTGIVYDIENNDEFLPLKIVSQEGSFVGEVKEEFKKILIDIRDNCFLEKHFLSTQANRITKLLISKYGDNPEYMWKDAPLFGVFRNSVSKKWYGIIMNIPRTKLGEDDKSIVEILNIKLDSEKIQKLLKKEGFYPAWHMNKKYWITITLDETLSDKEILDLLEESYSFTVNKKNGKIRKQ